VSVTGYNPVVAHH